MIRTMQQIDDIKMAVKYYSKGFRRFKAVLYR